jgi:hypothetical protein
VFLHKREGERRYKKMEDTNDIYEELSEDYKDHVSAILEVEQEDLEELSKVDNQTLTLGTWEYRWFRDEEEAEAEARTYLTEDDYLWKVAVAAGRTTDGLREWVEDVIRMDGWGAILCSYDGYERVAQLKDGTWFPYIRTN